MLAITTLPVLYRVSDAMPIRTQVPTGSWQTQQGLLPLVSAESRATLSRARWPSPLSGFTASTEVTACELDSRARPRAPRG